MILGLCLAQVPPNSLSIDVDRLGNLPLGEALVV
jgi:hypothetical protein